MYQIASLLKYEIGFLDSVIYRSFASLAFSCFITILLMPSFISFMKGLHKLQPMRFGTPDSHMTKEGTPTMGGAILVFSVVLSSLLLCDLSNKYIRILIFTILSFAVVGGIDDCGKMSRSCRKDLSPQAKLVGQILLSYIIIFFANDCASDSGYCNMLIMPFFNIVFNCGLVYTILRIIAIVGSSNAVNLTDGLDGLVTVPIMISAACLGVCAYLSGHLDCTKRASIYCINEASEITVFCGAIIGAMIGFLRFNVKPAKIFMGDVGSLSFGGVLGAIAVITKNEILFIIIGGLFVMEAVSVILQVLSFKITGKRMFKIAPIHHHFEASGWSEVKVVMRFWIIAALCGVFGLCALR